MVVWGDRWETGRGCVKTKQSSERHEEKQSCGRDDGRTTEVEGCGTGGFPTQMTVCGWQWMCCSPAETHPLPLTYPAALTLLLPHRIELTSVTVLETTKHKSMWTASSVLRGRSHRLQENFQNWKTSIIGCVGNRVGLIPYFWEEQLEM